MQTGYMYISALNCIFLHMIYIILEIGTQVT